MVAPRGQTEWRVSNCFQPKSLILSIVNNLECRDDDAPDDGVSDVLLWIKSSKYWAPDEFARKHRVDVLCVLRLQPTRSHGSQLSVRVGLLVATCHCAPILRAQHSGNDREASRVCKSILDNGGE